MSVGVVRKFDPSMFISPALTEPSFLPVWGGYAAMAGKPVARAGAKGLATLGSAVQAIGRAGQKGVRGLASSLGPASKLKKPTLKVGDWDHKGRRVQSDDERAVDYDPAMQLVNDARAPVAMARQVGVRT